MSNIMMDTDWVTKRQAAGHDLASLLRAMLKIRVMPGVDCVVLDASKIAEPDTRVPTTVVLRPVGLGLWTAEGLDERRPFIEHVACFALLHATATEDPDQTARCTCEWMHPMTGTVLLMWPAEIDPECGVHGGREPKPFEPPTDMEDDR